MRSICFGGLLLLAIACNTNKTADVAPMSGAYKMLTTSATGSFDTTINDPYQLKIFTADYMMYANVTLADSSSSFGIATYSVNNDTLTENIIYSGSDSVGSDSAASFKLEISKTPNGYKQLIKGMRTSTGSFDLTETYESVGNSTTSPLDGAWKLTKVLLVNGSDTQTLTPLQYKVYNAGYVIWGGQWTDSAKKLHTGIGYGTFTMTDNKVKESMIASTYKDIRGRDFDIDIELIGTNGFKQTIKEGDTAQHIEIYQKLKK